MKHIASAIIMSAAAFLFIYGLPIEGIAFVVFAAFVSLFGKPASPFFVFSRRN